MDVPSNTRRGRRHLLRRMALARCTAAAFVARIERTAGAVRRDRTIPAWALTLVTTLLSGCLGGGGGGADDAPLPPALRDERNAVDAASAYYVTEFLLADVAAVRASARFAIQRLNIDYGFTGNPLLAGVTIVNNAFEAARVEYAHSVGLTGLGQLVAINDTSIDVTHPEFAGKSITTSGAATAERFHGTAVASVLAGSNTSGDMMGVAPNASLHVGQLDFDPMIGVTFEQIGGYFDDARALGAVVSSNSWNLAGSTFATTDYRDYLTGGRRDLLDAMRRFAQNGVIVFGVQNDFNAGSVNELNGLPIAFPDLQGSWIAAMSAVPVMRDGRIVAAFRQSAACNEAAAFCIAANGALWAANADTGGYGAVAGTSFAVPQVAGAIAILAEAFPQLSAQQLRDRLLATADNSFFTPEGSVSFAPGLVHGYSREFGHGFIDLRAALLPIGPVAVPVENAPAQPVSVPIVVAGGASGDALVEGLSARGIVVTDSLGGAFAAQASSLAAQMPREDDDADLLNDAMALDQRAALAARRAGLAGTGPALVAGGASLLPGHASAATFAGLDPVTIPFAMAEAGRATPGTGWAMRAYVPRDDSAATGLAVLHRRDLGPLALEAGIEMARAEGSMLGIVVPGAVERMHTDTLSLQFGLGWRPAPGVALRARGEWGLADGPGAGVVAGFEDTRYSAYEIGIDLADVARAGDTIGLSLRQPLAITAGRADLRLAAGVGPGGAVRFADVPVGLAPDTRQIDLALDYLAPMGASSSFGFGLRHAWNHGHIPGETALNAVAVAQWRF